jgi:glycosyltransferase involved in cell wall biosynthesis
MKTISFAIPCYNSADYMEKCLDSLIDLGQDIEIIIVDDGSTKDNTAEIGQSWALQYPGVVKFVHKENGGHGSAVNAGLKAATGLYFKVVDSDDWLDAGAMAEVMAYLRAQVERQCATDMVIANYVYEKVYENKRTVIHYESAFPKNKEFTWDEVGSFGTGQYLLMHSVIYRTELLRDMNLQLPEHCFYVDNIFVYEPLVNVRTMYYLDVDMYRYFIGREDQSVNEKTMMGRIDQQLRVTRHMIDCIEIGEVSNRRLRKYLERYLSMMMTICTVFLRMRNTDEDDDKLQEIWLYLKAKDASLYRRIRTNLLNVGANLPTKAGRKASISGYHIAQKIFKFN